MSDLLRCHGRGCDKTFTHARYLTRHLNTCEKVQKAQKRLFEAAASKSANDPGASTKRQRVEAGSATIRSRLFRRVHVKATNQKEKDVEDDRMDDNLEASAPGSPSAGMENDIPGVGVHVSSLAESPPSTPLPTKRVRKLTERFKAMLGDTLPEGPGPLAEEPLEPEIPPETLRIRIRRSLKTLYNSFSLRRTYYGRPSRTPDADVGFGELVSDDFRGLRGDRPTSGLTDKRDEGDIITPYPNMSTFLFNRWFWKGPKKTKESRKDLLDNVILGTDFNPDDLRGVNFDRLDEEVAKNPGGVSNGRGWAQDTVYIEVPTGKKQTKASKKADAARRRRVHDSDSEEDAAAMDSEPFASRRFGIPGLHHRKLVDVIVEVFSSTDAKNFHMHPFEEHWQPPWNEEATERVHGELFTSQAFLDADRELFNSPPEPDCDLPRVIAATMLYSDATHVAQFGQAKLWPVYTFFGNQSKYDRGRPSSRAGHIVAFFPSLPDNITDFIRQEPGTNVTAPLLAHCRRDLFHGCWEIILDAEFLHAYEHGIVVVCGDGIKRRVYPRIFTYSADYPEKVLVATIRDMGQCPCPRCKIRKDDIPDLGKPVDMATRSEQQRCDDENRRSRISKARDLIYEKGYVVNSDHVEDLLKEESLVPTVNAFSKLLSRFGLDVFDLVVVDLMHELELGVWKAILLHLIRILYSQGQATVFEFNERFRRVASFGRSTIRAFPYNVADLKKLAARDFEDILQCCIPCFEGLLPEPHNQTILDLLYLIAYFHSLAKLRMHTSSSLQILREVTTALGNALRYFAEETCRHFKTYETDREYQARNRAAARQVAKAQSVAAPSAPTSAQPTSGSAAAAPALPVSSSSPPSMTTPARPDLRSSTSQAATHISSLSSGKREKTFNLKTSKAHALGDYADQIEKFGTLDSLSTILGESTHRIVKAFNSRTNHNNAVPQIVNVDTRTAVHTRMTNELAVLPAANDMEAEDIPESSLSQEQLMNTYHIAAVDTKNKRYLPEWVREHHEDPAFQDFIPCLKAHLLARYLNLPFNGEAVTTFSPAEVSDVVIQHNQIYAHATAAFNFTSYDIRREQDTINVNTWRCDIMLPSFEDEGNINENTHPYWYARVLGVYHVLVHFSGSWRPQRFDFLWVQWFGRDMEWRGGPSMLQLDRVGFVPGDDPDAFGFIDPSLVIRACHLIPAYSLGRTVQLLRPSFARDEEGDWVNYYIMRFVDRDMMMRYLGLGVGHCQTAAFPCEEQLKDILTGPSYVPIPMITVSALPQRQGEENEGEENEGGEDGSVGDEDGDDDDSLFNEELYEL